MQAQAAAIAYFVFAAVCLGLCAGSYLYLERLPFTKFYLARAATATGASASTGVEGLDKRLSLQEGSGTASDEEEDSIMMSLTSSGNGKGGAARRSFEVGSSSDSAPLTGAPSTAITAVLRGIWPMAAAVFSVFFMTFLVFPGVAPASVEFKNTWGSMRVGNDWWNAILLLVFNVADTIGRAAPAWVQLLKGYPLLVSDGWRPQSRCKRHAARAACLTARLRMPFSPVRCADRNVCAVRHHPAVPGLRAVVVSLLR